MTSSHQQPPQWTYYLSTDFFDQHGDPRVANYRLMRTPWPVVAMCVCYLVFVKLIGPSLMKNRRPLELTNFIRVYNLAMVALNGAGVYWCMSLLNYGLDAWGCRPIDTSDTSPKSLRIIELGHLFLESRLVEFVDTICFVLRKKSRQISNFHVFHHFSVPMAVWTFVKFVPGGNSAIFPILNTAIHTVMYSYYFLATFKHARPYLGWKKYLTQAQIVQFLVMIVHSAQPLFLADCSFPRAFLLVNIFFSFVFIYLFVNFYVQNYGKRTVQIARRLSRRVSQQVHRGVRRLSTYNSLNLSSPLVSTAASTYDYNNLSSQTTTDTTKQRRTIDTISKQNLPEEHLDEQHEFSEKKVQ